MTIFHLLIVIISIIIILGCAYFKSLKEGLTNNDYIILIGDSVLNNANYVPSGKSVFDILKTKTNNILNVAKDGATISELYQQLNNIPIDLNTTQTYIFISIGGNDILNKHITLDNAGITTLFNSYNAFLKALRAKLPNTQINIMNLYLPYNSRYLSYKQSIDQWNKLININSNKVGENYNVISLNTILTSPKDFVYDIEPSETASIKIANAIYLS
jgi:lysophospholipase L1-like esterase